MRVLVVDDSEIALAVMKQALVRDGHEVLTLPSPIGVTRTIVRERIDVVVIDVHLPSARGDRIAALFRKQTSMARLGVVLVSGVSVGELEQLRAESQADAALSKGDIDEKLSQAVVRAYTARRQA